MAAWTVARLYVFGLQSDPKLIERLPRDVRRGRPLPLHSDEADREKSETHVKRIREFLMTGRLRKSECGCAYVVRNH